MALHLTNPIIRECGEQANPDGTVANLKLIGCSQTRSPELPPDFAGGRHYEFELAPLVVGGEQVACGH